MKKTEKTMSITLVGTQEDIDWWLEQLKVCPAIAVSINTPPLIKIIE